MPTQNESAPNTDSNVCNRWFEKKDKHGAALGLMIVLVSLAVAGTITMYQYNSALWLETAVTSWLIVFVPLGYTIEHLSDHRNAKCFVGVLNAIGIVCAAALQGWSILSEAGAI